MMSIYKTEDGYICYIKGAPDRLTSFFSKFRAEGGNEDEYSKYADQVTQINNGFA